MKLCSECSCGARCGFSSCGRPVSCYADGHARGFTLPEVVITMALVLILILGSFNTILFMNFSSRRLADTTAVMAIAQAKLEEIRAATYNPPNSPFTASTVYLTNSESISLDKSGTSYRVPGTIISEIKPIGVSQGHLVTVTATFPNAEQPLNPNTVTLQTVVNRFSGGQEH